MDFLTTDLSNLNDQTILNLYQTELGNTQGYGPVGHGRSYVSLGLLRFSEADKAAVCQQLAAWGLRASSALDLRQKRLDYGNARDSGNEPARLAAKAGGVIAAGLSASGFTKLSLPYPNHEVNMIVPNDFESGFHMALKSTIPDTAQKVEPFDAVVIIASDDNQQQLPGLREQIQNSFGPIANIHWESGGKLPGNVDHFGFAEDIGQPVIFPDPEKNTATWTSGWKPNAQPNLVLAPVAGFAKEYGSYMAYLKIEQHVDDFNNLAAQAAAVMQKPLDQVKAWILGRYQTGEPLQPKGAALDDFVYTGNGPCPVAAHIRKMNNRDQRSFRVVRRGVFYEENGSKGALFQCFQSSLEYGFMALWGWAFDQNTHSAGAGQDPFLGERSWPPTPYSLPSPAGQASVRRLTTVQHGEFFYFPSIPFFDRLRSAAVPDSRSGKS